MSLANFTKLIQGKTVTTVTTLPASDVTGIRFTFDDGSYLKLRGTAPDHCSFEEAIELGLIHSIGRMIHHVEQTPSAPLYSTIFPGASICFMDGAGLGLQFQYWYDVSYKDLQNNSYTLRIEQGSTNAPRKGKLHA
jgi:hypothetical protein